MGSFCLLFSFVCHGSTLSTFGNGMFIIISGMWPIFPSTLISVSENVWNGRITRAVPVCVYYFVLKILLYFAHRFVCCFPNKERPTCLRRNNFKTTNETIGRISFRFATSAHSNDICIVLYITLSALCIFPHSFAHHQAHCERLYAKRKL